MTNWGIIGTSFISDTFAKAVVATGQTNYAIAARRPGPLEEFRSKYGFEKVYTDYQQLLDDENVDCVYIALPNHLHADFVIDAAKAGKNVLVEKSFDVSLEKTQRALETAKEANVFVMEGLMYLTHPMTRKLVDTLPEIGKLQSISAAYCANICKFTNPGSKGAIFNLGCYPLSLARLVYKTIGQSGVAFSAARMDAVGTIDRDGNVSETTANLWFGDASTMTIHTSETYGKATHFQVVGTKGTITFDSNPWLQKGDENSFRVVLNDGTKRTVTENGKGDCFFHEVELVQECLQQGLKQAPAPAARWADSIEIMDALTRWEKIVLDKHK